ncbi:MAG: DNA polymerase [Acidobacteria bacterium]|nr:MAG: DNA polymerase [Acidobacteriota bacterium]
MQGLAAGSDSFNWLFVDLNAYFASVEQQDRPELRGKPVAVVQVMTPNTVCIAASYQAKPFGVKTGVKVRDAQKLCPELTLILARPRLYVEYHHRILEAIETCLPIDEVLSIDEAACRLVGSQRQEAKARALALGVKRAVRGVGEVLTCSVGLAPNRYLAKVASDMHKPDGLTLLRHADLPQALFGLKPGDLPGIGARTEARLKAKGLHTVEQLCALTRPQLGQLNGVWGERLWHWLRGEDFDAPSSGRHSIGRQHVLPPESRSRDAALAIARKLLDSAAAELRKQELWARGLGVAVKFLGDRPAFRAERRIDDCRDSFVFQDLLTRLWSACPPHKPLLVSVWLADVTESSQRTPGLFEETPAKSTRASEAMDTLNRRFGAGTLYPASLHDSRTAARRGIAFRKVPDLDQF